ncbi:MAG: hypothetical protein [Circular genetic element sp.]|nr:MAG: hypothetical protein [Circular genetic element sp.]
MGTFTSIFVRGTRTNYASLIQPIWMCKAITRMWAETAFGVIRRHLLTLVRSARGTSLSSSTWISPRRLPQGSLIGRSSARDFWTAPTSLMRSRRIPRSFLGISA